MLLCLLPCAALAQAPTATNHGPVQMSEDRSCTRFPYGTLGREAHGTAKFTLNVGSDGSVHDIAMTLPSGDKDLDQAAYACVQSRTYLPALKDGQPVAFPLESMVTFSAEKIGRLGDMGDIVWKTPHVVFAGVLASGGISSHALACIRATPDIAAKAHSAQTPTGLRISYHKGEIDHVTVVSSSGDPGLDQIAQDCFTAVPKDSERAKTLDKTLFTFFTVPWQRLFAPATATSAAAK